MKQHRSYAIASFFVIAAASVGGCRDNALAPVAPAAKLVTAPSLAPWRSGVLAPMDTFALLRRRRPLSHDVARSLVIGPEGGTLAVGEAGLRLVVPKGAVTAPTTFTVTALAGDRAAYEFEPAGSTYERALRIEQETGTLDLAPNAPAIAGYFASRADLADDASIGRVRETRPATRRAGNTLSAEIYHFSGYVYATGFTTVDPEPQP